MLAFIPVRLIKLFLKHYEIFSKNDYVENIRRAQYGFCKSMPCNTSVNRTERSTSPVRCQFIIWINDSLLLIEPLTVNQVEKHKFSFPGFIFTKGHTHLKNMVALAPRLQINVTAATWKLICRLGNLIPFATDKTTFRSKLGNKIIS